MKWRGEVRLPEFLVQLTDKLRTRLQGKWADTATYVVIYLAILYVGGHLIAALLRR